MELNVIPPRRPDWRARLVDYLGRQAAAKFRPGTCDCGLFAAGAVEAMTGFDPAARWRGKYRTLAAGFALVQADGYADHAAVFANLYPDIAPALAQIGDIAVLPGDAGSTALGVVQGGGVYCRQPGGMAVVSRLEIKGAFSIC
jgi:putative hemolysin